MAIYETNVNDVISFIDLENYPKNESLFIKRELIRDLSSTLRLIFQRIKYDSFIHSFIHSNMLLFEIIIFLRYVLRNLTEKKMAR